MKLIFLQASVPLTKTYTKTAEGIEKSSYPNVYEVTSIEEEVKDMRQFAAALEKHAALGHCLLKGDLLRPLVNESRAGSTDPNGTTRIACHDVDGAKFKTPDEFMKSVGMGDVSYVVQFSPSYKIYDNLLRCHIFFLLDKDYAAPVLKQHLIALNFKIPALKEAISLTRTGNALRYALDITTCQNDKLIYIAHPICKGFKPPINERIVFVKKKEPTWSFKDTVSPVANRSLVEEHIATLRKAASLPERKNQYKHHKNIEILSKPDQSIITGIKEERGFVYFNLNGGDSWAYYHPSNNPEFIFNFKGEPTYLTKELLPEYWAQINTKEKRNNTAAAHTDKGVVYLAFLDKRSSAYWRGTYNEASDILDLYIATSETQVRHFALQNGFALPEFVPEWELVFDPQADFRVDRANQRVNIYQPSEYLRKQSAWTGKKKKSGDWKTIRKVLHHALGSVDEITEYHINWLAYIVQNKDRTLTAWVMQGRTGTGKGLYMNHVLAPLFGRTQVAMKRMEELEEPYNGYMERAFIVFVDEVQTSVMKNERGVMAKIKNFITEPTISVRNMYQSARPVRNFTNWIFASNMPDPVHVDMNDRRFNVGRYQDEPLEITTEEIAELETELPAFADMLMKYPVDEKKAKTPLNTQYRDNLMRISEASIDTVAGALLSGNFEFFLEQLPTVQPTNNVTMDIVEDYKSTLMRLIGRWDGEKCGHISRDELRVLFEWTVGDMPKTPNKFTSRMKHHRIHVSRLWIDGQSMQGITVNWTNLEVAAAKARLSGRPVVVKAEPQPAKEKAK